MLRINFSTDRPYYSRSWSWDNSYMNKVLVLTTENQKKKNDTPFEYLGKQIVGKLFEVFGNATTLKSGTTLTENFDDKNGRMERPCFERYAVYGAAFKISFEQSLNLGKEIVCKPATDHWLRTYYGSIWGFSWQNRRNDRHHALDVIVIVRSTHSKVWFWPTNWNKRSQTQNPAERPLPSKPWESFREDARVRLLILFLSLVCQWDNFGAAHEDTTVVSGNQMGRLFNALNWKILKRYAWKYGW